LTLLRLIFLAILLAILGRYHLRDVQLHAFSVQIALSALTLAFALAGVYAAILRTGRHFKQLAYAQVILDQLTWTALVYVSGGATSGATSLYGLSALTAAILGGLPLATLAASAGYLLYSALTALMLLDILKQPPDQLDVHYVNSIDQAIYPLGLNLLVLVVVTMLAGYLAERLRFTGGELRAVTERALQAEKLASLGKISAGLAHEIRNPLGSISASIELLRDAPGMSAEDRRLCEIIRTESLRLNDLVGDMLDLTRHRPPTVGKTDLAATAREVASLASRLGRTAQDVTVLCDSPPEQSVELMADPSQLRQVIWNLLRNAVQAASPGTQVTVRVNAASHPVPNIQVHDFGAGIDEQAMAHLFDVFYTNRSNGTGIGLAVVKRIVDDHDWAIDVGSNEADGTTFTVVFGQR